LLSWTFSAEITLSLPKYDGRHCAEIE